MIEFFVLNLKKIQENWINLYSKMFIFFIRKMKIKYALFLISLLVSYVALRRKLGRKIIFALPHVLARQLPRILT